MEADSAAAAAGAALAPLREDPRRAAVLSDIDGTLAPIADRPEEAQVPEQATALLGRLSRRYGVVGCVSGRRAAEARRMVGVEGIAYAGNHGLEVLMPGEREPRIDPSIGSGENAAANFLAAELGTDAGATRGAGTNATDPPPALSGSGLRLEDKGPIQALHWRGAADEEAAEAWAREIAEAATRSGLESHWGRKVLELRPPGGGGKGAAVEVLIDGGGEIAAAVYAGDDRTDIDAFRRLREMRERGRLRTALCIGIASPEGPAELRQASDLTVTGPAAWLDLLRLLAA